MPSQDRSLLNSSRLLLSRVRGGDYAHAGDRKAIDIVLEKVLSLEPDLKSKAVLDVGCGCGGTAQYLYEAGFSHVNGIDLDLAAISYAQRTYPALSFTVADALTIDKIYPPSHFSFIYMFNSLYAFPDKLSLLTKLWAVAKPDCLLAIFDYTEKKALPTLLLRDLANKPLYPLHLKEMEQDLIKTGWEVVEVSDITAQYIQWYKELLGKLSNSLSLLGQEFTEQDIAKTTKTFTVLLSSLEEGILGGAILYARKQKTFC